MKKIILSGIFASIICTCAYASDMYTETETINTYETISVDTVTYVDTVYTVPVRTTQPARVATPCRAASSIDVARNNCGCNKQPVQRKLNPVRIKTYSEVIDHYQVYQPVITYKPAGTYTTRRYIDNPNPKFGTCAR